MYIIEPYLIYNFQAYLDYFLTAYTLDIMFFTLFFIFILFLNFTCQFSTHYFIELIDLWINMNILYVLFSIWFEYNIIIYKLIFHRSFKTNKLFYFFQSGFWIEHLSATLYCIIYLLLLSEFCHFLDPFKHIKINISTYVCKWCQGCCRDFSANGFKVSNDPSP